MHTMTTTYQHPSKPRAYTVEELWSLVEAVPFNAAGASRQQAMEQLAAALGLPLAPEPPKLPARVHAGPQGFDVGGLYDEAGWALVTCVGNVPECFSTVDLATRRAFMIEAGRRYNACGEILDRMRGSGFVGGFPEVLDEILRILRGGGEETR